MITKEFYDKLFNKINIEIKKELKDIEEKDQFRNDLLVDSTLCYIENNCI
jgi:hypothetical protein